MSNYSLDYYRLIMNGLENIVVTDYEGDSINIDDSISQWCERALYVRERSRGLIFFCGNGASASLAEHMSHDWFQNAKLNTTTCSEVSHITAISNDLSYDEVFSYRVKRILSADDMLVGISSSGNSSNIINAISAAKENGAYTISVSGMKSGNTIRRMADLNFYVPLNHYGEVESAHAILLHMVLDCFLDNYMGGRH